MNPSNTPSSSPSYALNSLKDRRFLDHAKIKVPVICGAMYPCSNPELVAAASEGGGLGVVQPLSLTYVHGYDLREGLKKIRSLTAQPYGFNILTEASSKVYQDRMKKYLDVALEEGCRFFVSALGNPKWIVDRVSSVGGIVYHDVTEKKWAEKALAAGVHGLIAVNNRAGGHLGTLTPEKLWEDLSTLGVPVVGAGGAGNAEDVKKLLNLGYAGVQMGTRFIATTECTAHATYKDAILKAQSSDIVASERITGVPVSIIRTPEIDRMGLKAGPLARWMLKNPKLKHWARLWFSIKSFRDLKKVHHQGSGHKDFWQAGKSVDSINSIESAAQIMRSIGQSL
jgi:nitronate monooxygenase